MFAPCDTLLYGEIYEHAEHIPMHILVSVNRVGTNYHIKFVTKFSIQSEGTHFPQIRLIILMLCFGKSRILRLAMTALWLFVYDKRIFALRKFVYHIQNDHIKTFQMTHANGSHDQIKFKVIVDISFWFGNFQKVSKSRETRNHMVMTDWYDNVYTFIHETLTITSYFRFSTNFEQFMKKCYIRSSSRLNKSLMCSLSQNT